MVLWVEEFINRVEESKVGEQECKSGLQKSIFGEEESKVGV
jgi:hypothetical protein